MTSTSRGALRALVTGGTRGVGAAIAAALHQAGNEVFVTGRSPGGSGPPGCEYLACDFAEPAQLSLLADQVVKIDPAVLVNNAGINHVAPLESYDPDVFQGIQQVNVTAPFILTRAVIPGMRRRGFGRIVNITSIFGLVGRPGRSAYSASKAALAGLTRALALEVATDNVLVNCVAPGVVDTDLTRKVLGDAGIDAIRAQIPMGRLAQPAEIANLVAFLVSSQNTYLTGQTIVIDGGFTCA